MLSDSEKVTTSIAIDLARRYLRAAGIQVARIWDRPVVDARQRPLPHVYEDMLIDVHFYFVAWVNCRNMMKVFSALPEYSNAGKYLRSVSKHFDDYAEARNTFEHFHDRLPAGKKYEKVVEVQEPGGEPHRCFGGFKDGSYVFSNRSWDISPASLKLLESFVTKFLGRIECVVEEKLAALIAESED